MDPYSDVVMDHFQNPRNVGLLDQCDLRGCAGTPGNGPFMLFTVRLHSNRVAEVGFQTYGCGPAIAAGSLMTELTCGRALSETSSITRDDLLAALGGLPDDKVHCADLAIEAWRSAVMQMSNHRGTETQRIQRSESD